MFGRVRRRKSVWFSLLTFFILVSGGLFLISKGRAAAPAAQGTNAANTPIVSSSSLGEYAATFAGPAATGCASNGCALLTGPTFVPAVEPSASPAVASSKATHHAMPDLDDKRYEHLPSSKAVINPPTVSCEPTGPGCDNIDSASGGAIGVKGLNAVDSAEQASNVTGQNLEPPDQGLCAGNGYAVETNNQGEVLVFDAALHRKSAVISLDTIMGLTAKGWSSGGDPSCVYDYDNGGHWFFTEIVSASNEADGGPFAGCFAGVANSCYEGIAVSTGSSPYGPYAVYYLAADYNPAEPGYPYLLNDFAKIGTSRDAFLLFYDEFPLVVPGLGGGGFNGAQELAFNKNALEKGLPVLGNEGKPNPNFTVAIENMGLLPTPDGTCFSDDQFHEPSITCWFSVIPAHPADSSQFDNSHGGSAFMLESLDFYLKGDTRIAVFDWTGLKNLNSPNCSTCSGIQFGGTLFAGVNFYYGEGFLAAQKKGPIPLGNECGAAGLSVGSPPPAKCPEGPIATNGDNFTEASQGNHHLWGAISTEIGQTYSSSSSPEIHQGVAYWVIRTDTFDTSDYFTLSGQGYVSARHEDLEFPAMASGGTSSEDGGNGNAIITFSLSGNGGPTGADHGGFYPSTAYGRLTSSSSNLLDAKINIADLGQSPQDGFTEYDGYPVSLRPRWGDYSAAVFVPWSGGKIYFSTNYIQYPSCTGSAFSLANGTCGGTRNGFSNWGTSVNSVVP